MISSNARLNSLFASLSATTLDKSMDQALWQSVRTKGSSAPCHGFQNRRQPAKSQGQCVPYSIKTYYVSLFSRPGLRVYRLAPKYAVSSATGNVCYRAMA